MRHKAALQGACYGFALLQAAKPYIFMVVA